MSETVMISMSIGDLSGYTGLAMASLFRSLNVSGQYYYAGLAVLIVLVLIAVVKAYRVWQEIHEVDEPDSPADLLQTFEEARAAGEIDDAELERVRQRLGYGSRPSDAKGAGPRPDDRPLEPPA